MAGCVHEICLSYGWAKCPTCGEELNRPQSFRAWLRDEPIQSIDQAMSTMLKELENKIRNQQPRS